MNTKRNRIYGKIIVSHWNTQNTAITDPSTLDIMYSNRWPEVIVTDSHIISHKVIQDMMWCCWKKGALLACDAMKCWCLLCIWKYINIHNVPLFFSSVIFCFSFFLLLLVEWFVVFSFFCVHLCKYCCYYMSPSSQLHICSTSLHVVTGLGEGIQLHPFVL